MSIWADIHRRSNGTQVSKEDEVIKKIEAELDSFRTELTRFTDSFLDMAKKAFNENDRYTCAIYYSLYAIALNKDRIDEDVVVFLREYVFCRGLKVSSELSLDETQKKAVVNSIFDRSIKGFGHAIASFDFKAVENTSFPFEGVENKGCTFFDFIGICKNVERFPDIRNI